MNDHQVLDAEWADLARGSREALRQLGYDITADCLPDEAAPCGGSFALHTAAHLATLRAVAEHHAGHLGGAFQPVLAQVYEHAREEVSHW